MPIIDRQNIRTDIGRVTDWLITGTTDGAGGAAGVSIKDTSLYSEARDQHVRNRSVVGIVESGHATRGQRRFATGPPDTGGVVAVSPSFSAQVDTGAQGIAYEIWDADGPHPDDIDRCIDRALAEACWYWRLVPLTDLIGGDVGDELSISGSDIKDDQPTPVTLFTGTNSTPSLVELEPPDEFARRAIRVTASASPGYQQSQQIEVDPDDRQDWRIEALVRAGAAAAGAAAGDARLVLFDVTNSATFTADVDPFSWTNRGWGLLEAGFTVPTTCQAFAVRLQVQTNTQIGDFAWIQVWQQNQGRFSLPRRFSSKRHVGQVYERIGTLHSQFRRGEWRGGFERREAMGRGVSILLWPPPGSSPMWFYEKTSYPALTTATPAATDDDNQTWIAGEWIRTAALVECYRFLRRRDKREYPERWLEEMADAEAELGALQADYGIEPMLTEDSTKPIGRAYVKV